MSMKRPNPCRRAAALLCAVALTLSGTAAFAAADGLDNFKAIHTYQAGQFTDIPSGIWYEENVKASYEYGLVEGTTPTTFAPDASLKLSEAVKLAACLHSVYHTGSADFARTTPWYQSYVDYATENGLLAQGSYDFDQYATRAQFADLFAAALPEQALPAINTVEDGAIPDVPMTADCAGDVYLLYRAGILTGSDGNRFQAGTNMKRSEAAALLTRMTNPSLRKSVTLTADGTAPSGVSYYSDFPLIPDFGAMYGITASSVEQASNASYQVVYRYAKDETQDTDFLAKSVVNYLQYLLEHGFLCINKEKATYVYRCTEQPNVALNMSLGNGKVSLYLTNTVSDHPIPGTLSYYPESYRVPDLGKLNHQTLVGRKEMEGGCVQYVYEAGGDNNYVFTEQLFASGYSYWGVEDLNGFDVYQNYEVNRQVQVGLSGTHVVVLIFPAH